MKIQHKQEDTPSDSKFKIGLFRLTGCNGCRLAVSNREDQLQDTADTVTFPTKTSQAHVKKMDIALVEGQVSSLEDLDLLKAIRGNSNYLIALGTCACEGFIPAIEEYGINRNVEEKYLDEEAKFTPLDEPGPLDKFVEVDYYIRGCPVRGDLLYYLDKFRREGINKNMLLRFPLIKLARKLDLKSVITFDPDKCIFCRRCEIVCSEALGVHAIGVSGRGVKAKFSTPFDVPLDETNCIYCGQCIANCPVGAFDVLSSVETTLEMFEDDENFVIAIIDPTAVSSAVENPLFIEKNIDVILRKIISALKDMGAKKAINFLPYEYLSAAAQAELMNKNDLILTSWCSSALDYIKNFYPKYVKHVHEETSPEALLLKHVKYLYNKEKPKTFLMTPCVSKKRNERFDSVLASREIPTFFSAKDIWLNRYPSEGTFDDEIGVRMGYISSDDLTPLILRIAYQMMFGNLEVTLTTNPLEKGVSEYSLEGDEGSLRGLVIKRLSKSRKYLEESISRYNVVQLISCPEGCITGGGQYPTVSDKVVENRRKLLESYGEVESPTKLVPEIIEAYSRLKGEI